MNLTDNYGALAFHGSHPPVGLHVYYGIFRTTPDHLYMGMIVKATKRELEVFVPHITGGGWDRASPNTILTFTKRANGVWGEKDDIPAYNKLLFVDAETEKSLRSTFDSLGGHLSY